MSLLKILKYGSYTCACVILYYCIITNKKAPDFNYKKLPKSSLLFLHYETVFEQRRPIKLSNVKFVNEMKYFRNIPYKRHRYIFGIKI